MKKRILCISCIIALLATMLVGCGEGNKEVKIGVSFGVGEAVRWVHEKEYMEAKAAELGANIEVRLNKTDEPKTQTEDCIEMIDSGIDVLILTPRDASKVGEILAYAEEKNVPVISYARVVLGQKIDLFVGYDCGRIGQQLGKYLIEMVDHGDYIILSGDKEDSNAQLLYDGAMVYISQIEDDINIIMNENVPGWSPDEAKRMVKEAVAQNGNKVDGILAPNDKLAGASATALAELGVTTPVVITGMDSEVEALQRIVAGTQSVTVYMDLEELAHTAVQEAYHMAANEKVTVNAEFDNNSGAFIDANLITGKLITKENIDKFLIESGQFSKEEIYGEQ